MDRNKISFEKRVDLYYEDYDNYLLEIIKEVIPKQLCSLYKYKLIRKNETLRQYIGSICDVFNFRFDFNDIRKDVEEILKVKYDLKITNDNPLIMEKCE